LTFFLIDVCLAQRLVHRPYKYNLIPKRIPHNLQKTRKQIQHILESNTTNMPRFDRGVSTLTLTAITLLSLVPTTHSIYTLTDSYAGTSFFGNFTPFTAVDPTNGFVSYHPYSSATTQKLIGTVANFGSASYIGVDHTSTLQGGGGGSGGGNGPSSSTEGGGRAAVRLGSTKTFNKGLFVADIAHMPGEECGTWPAFWLVGPDWPKGGEIDIIEGVNGAGENQMTLHTSAGCSISRDKHTYPMAGDVKTANCDGDAPGQDKNAGCAVLGKEAAGFGKGFNANGGGVYAMEWTSRDILIWFFPRGQIPPGLLSVSSAPGGTKPPDPKTWGTPAAHFCGECDIDAHFRDMQIVFDTTFCGDWAGKAWAKNPACAAKAPTCEAYVGANPARFKDEYWLVNRVEVFAAEADNHTAAGAKTGAAHPAVAAPYQVQKPGAQPAAGRRRRRSLGSALAESEKTAPPQENGFVEKSDLLGDEILQ